MAPSVSAPVVVLDGNSLSIEQIVAVARQHAPVGLAPAAREQVQRSRDFLEKCVRDGMAIYGVTTGIGELARVRISPEQSAELSRRIIYSHSAGTGDPFPEDAVRAAMLLRANVLAKGCSGVRPCLLDTVLAMINRNVVPYINEKGSLGVSGDLSPMSQFAEVAIGEGRAWYQGELLPGGEAMKRAGIKPTDLTYKEGLGLINGSQMMTGGAALLVYDAERVLKNAVIAAAMSLDALRAVERAFDPTVHRARAYPGQNAVAANLLRLFAGSQIMADKTGKVQDGYSMRCTPQALGPSFDTLEHVRRIVNIEVNAAADNPLFFPAEPGSETSSGGQYFAAGNFHGQPVAMVMDFLCIALAEAADLSERHTNRLLNPVLSGLPDFLVQGNGLNSGLMVAQYTAAALVSENKVLSHPAVVDSISVSADQEDHVSMGPIAVRKCGEILRNVRAVLAIEMLCAAQAMDFHRNQSPRGSEGQSPSGSEEAKQSPSGSEGAKQSPSGSEGAKQSPSGEGRAAHTSRDRGVSGVGGSTPARSRSGLVNRRPGRGTAIAYDLIREKVPFMVDDRVLYPDIEAVRQLIESNTILAAVEQEVGPLLLARDVELPRPNVAY
ncbi:MAG: histidine ammonia-lyase [Planctomycetota bacterium]